MIPARSIRILTLAFLLAYLAIALAATWWALSGPTGIVQRTDNPRRARVASGTAQPDDNLRLTSALSTPVA